MNLTSQDEEMTRKSAITSLDLKMRQSNIVMSKEEILRRKREERLLKPKVWKQNCCQKRITKFLESCFIQTFMIIVTFWALFAEDLRFMALPKEVDPYWWGMTSFSLFAFSIEIMLAFYAKKEYRFSFFFFLDSLSTISLLFDIGWFLDLFQAALGGGDVSGA
jgi:hypothetical protein